MPLELKGRRQARVDVAAREIELREAKVKAEKLLNDAETSAKNTILKKERIEREIKEFIQTERELIKRYEES